VTLGDKNAAQAVQNGAPPRTPAAANFLPKKIAIL
jgi:hypothetical protein